MFSIFDRSFVVRRTKQGENNFRGLNWFPTWFFGGYLSLFFYHPSTIRNIHIYTPTIRFQGTNFAQDWEVFIGQDSRIKHAAFFQLAKYHDHW